MATAAATIGTDTGLQPLTVRLRPVLRLSDEQLFELSRLNRDLRFERTAEGDLLIMTPTGGTTGARGWKIGARLGAWIEADGTGVGFDSSTGFVLPNGAVRCPDAAWVLRARLASLTTIEAEQFLPLCPDFVIELRSPSDALAALEEKMREYVDNGAALGWLIDPVERAVHVYRRGTPPEVLRDPRSVSGDPLLPGFVLQLADIWNPW